MTVRHVWGWFQRWGPGGARGNLQVSECQFWEVPPWRGRSFSLVKVSLAIAHLELLAREIVGVASAVLKFPSDLGILILSDRQGPLCAHSSISGMQAAQGHYGWGRSKPGGEVP